MARLRTPVICTVIGEGGSGGALGIGVGDRLFMLQFSTYSVISPEGCASILWKSSERAADAAQAMGVTADRLRELGLIDGVIAEPLGGAHRDWRGMAETLALHLAEALGELSERDTESLLAQRYERLLGFGEFRE
jgi:acetyl-CoA carboxylase carboxyl transferase subunit alpha